MSYEILDLGMVVWGVERYGLEWYGGKRCGKVMGVLRVGYCCSVWLMMVVGWYGIW